MDVRFRCPSCSKSFKLVDPAPGTVKSKCPQCRAVLRITFVDNQPDALVEIAVPPPAAHAPTVPNPAPATASPPAPDPVDATIDVPPSPASAVASPAPRANSPSMAPTDPNVTMDVGGPSSPDETVDVGSVPDPRKPIPVSLSGSLSPSAAGRVTAAAVANPDSVPASLPGVERDIASASAPDESVEIPMPSRLGGYRVLGRLGRGGMGFVFKARQLSLDRDVALKVMKPALARDARFLSRFTREAYAAAQLTHHNVVQIHDIGADGDIPFFSMEYVEGQPLDALLKERGRLDPDEAVGLIIQAARGLAYAHRNGMIHRDVKPANLMLNVHGVVKVADLGLVKLRDETPTQTDKIELDGPPGASSAGKPRDADSLASDLRRVALDGLTLAETAMGTPAFMAPEQANDAAAVDARADVYSLGCTFYALVTGRPPFQGKTALEIIGQHATKPLVPPETLVPDLPPAISAVIAKMMAKNPDERYPDLDSVVRDLEQYLRERASGPFRPTREHAADLESAANDFRNVGLAKLRFPLALGFVGVCALLTLFSLPFGLVWALFWPALAVTGILAAFLLSGVLHGGVLVSRLRQYVFSGGPGFWFNVALAILLVVVAVWGLGLVPTAIFLAVLAVGVAVGWEFGVIRPLLQAREEPLAFVEEMLKTFRLKGMDEESIQAFVRDFSGDHWEEFFEALFGYEAMRANRPNAKPLAGGKPRPRFLPWRDRIVDELDRRQKLRREARDRKTLQRIEQKRLLQEGADLYSARIASERAARGMVAMASAFREQQRSAAGVPSTAGPRNFAAYFRAVADNPKGSVGYVRDSDFESEPFWKTLLENVLGARARFALGALVLVGFFLWMGDNHLLPTRDDLRAVEEVVRDAATDLERAPDVEVAKRAAERAGDVARGWWAVFLTKLRETETKPLHVPFLPDLLTRRFDSVAAGAAGLILIVSSLFRGIRMSFFAVPAAAVALIGPGLGLPFVAGPLTASLAGAAIFVLGLLFGRSRD